MKKIFVGITLLSLTRVNPTFAQSKELNPGDKVPNLSLSIYSADNVLKKVKLYNIRKKLVLFDFWSLTCASCIESFPKLDSLQEKYKDDIQIIIVNSESRNKTLQFFEKHKQIKKPKLLMISGDSILSKYFPRNYVPWHIWIDENKTVRFIANGYNANETNFVSFIKGEMPDMVQLTYYDDYVGDKPLIAEANGKFANRALYFSYIMPCILGATAHNFTGSSDDDAGKSVRFSRNCASIRRLFTAAFEEGMKYNFDAASKVELQVADPTQYEYPKDGALMDKFIEKHSYDYDLRIPVENRASMYTIVRQDLMRFFNVEAYLTRKKINCLVLEQLPGDTIVKSKGGKDVYDLAYESSSTEFTLKNRQLDNFTEYLRYVITEVYKIDLPFEVTLPSDLRIDIAVSKKIAEKGGFELLKEELKRYNLALTEKNYETEVLVIKEK